MDPRPRSSIRVLFVHGLESRPNGSKTRLLRAQGFEVDAPDLEMGVFQFRRRNSAVRQLLRLDETRIAGALTASLLGLAVKRSSALGVVGVAGLVGAWVLVRREAIMPKALARSFDASVAVVLRALKRSRPDIVVGSSWGGAVAAELVIEGAWDGPTVLLAPAVRRVCMWTRRPDAPLVAERLRAKSASVPIVVFHDPSDDVVPFADSVDLARGSAIDLRSVDAGGHRLLLLLERGDLADAIDRMLERP